jgi:predicted DCC family thiol-disulfide oxidoreductase YuxK
VLLFDGGCGLCNRLVRLLLRFDRRGKLAFAPLQGNAAQAFLRRRGLRTTDFDTLIFVPDWNCREGGAFLVRTDGVIAALCVTGSRGLGALAALLAVLPRPMRDAGYRAVGRWRYRLFGPWRPRPLARLEWQERFLDTATASGGTREPGRG